MHIRNTIIIYLFLATSVSWGANLHAVSKTTMIDMNSVVYYDEDIVNYWALYILKPDQLINDMCPKSKDPGDGGVFLTNFYMDCHKRTFYRGCKPETAKTLSA